MSRIVPKPVRHWGRDRLLRRGFGDYQTRLLHNALPRPNYAYCVYHGAQLAKRLGHSRISVLEFGVAGGGGLLALENHAEEVGKLLGLQIDVYGFDTGAGLPAPEDYRDLPYHWQAGFFAMDRKALESRLHRAKLIYGDIRQTVHDFVAKDKPAPIAAIMHDMDYYSSTAAGLSLFDGDPSAFLPRIFCYFDDVIGSEIELYSDYTGQRLAIADFNRDHPTKKIARNYHLVTREIVEPWYHQIFIYHDFAHPEYNKFVSKDAQQLPLNA